MYRSKESFERLFSIMPWLAIPYEDEKRRSELTEVFNVKAIPSLIIVDDLTETVITLEGREELNEDLEALVRETLLFLFWRSKPSQHMSS